MLFVAFSGFEYTAVQSFLISFAAGSADNQTICQSIAILDDGILEENKYFNVTLSTTDASVILENAVTTVLILDDDR